MPTRKQRRRRQKERRHDWEEVYVDETGRELAPDEAAEVAPPQTRGRENGRRAAGPRPTGRRAPDRPSWRRVAKRALIFAPLMFVVITVLDPDTSPPRGCSTRRSWSRSSCRSATSSTRSRTACTTSGSSRRTDPP